jgi:hypothetical protein
MALQITFAAEMHLAEGEFLIEQQTLNTETFFIYLAGI